MQRTPESRGIVVRRPTNSGDKFAVHVARGMPINATRGAMAALALPLPAHEDPSTEIAFRSLYLPMGMSPNTEVAPRGIEQGVQLPWQTHLGTGLFLPSPIAQLRTLEDNTRTKTLLVPSEVDLPFGPEVLGRLAWMVLARAPATAVAFIAADAAVRAEVLGSSLSPLVVAAMRFGQPRARRLQQLATDGERYYSHDTLRWVVREVAAAVAADAWSAAGLEVPRDNLDDQAAARLLFPCLLTDTAPTHHEAFRALWALHEAYTFSDSAFGSYDDRHEANLSMMTAIGAGQPQWGAWTARLEHWMRMLQLDDGDPALAGIRLKPSAFRAKFRSEVGLDTDEWLALMWFLGMRTMVMAQQDAPLHRQIGWLLSESLSGPLDARFAHALRSRAVMDLPSLGQAVLDELPHGTYKGLGSLPTVESMAMRNAPFLEIDPDVVIPFGVHVLADRAVALPKMVVGPKLGGVREVNGLIGKCFEALVRDAAITARPRHRVLTGDQIDAVVPAGQRCDAVIADFDHWLLIESGLQTLSAGFVRGNVQSIQDKCTDYQMKANQTEATAKHLGSLAKHYGLIPPRHVSHLVVTESTIVTVALVDELSRQNRRRNALFVASLAEFKWLVSAGAKWSIPSLISAWQAKGQPVSLQVHLWQTSLLAPVAGPQHDLDPAGWMSYLGTTLAA